MQKHKLLACIISLAVQLVLLITFAKSQDEEALAVVSAEMFDSLQSEVYALNNDMINIQEQLNALALRVQNTAVDTTQVGNKELEELQALINVANRQQDELSKLTYSNGIWQQNFRVINSTFAKLRKVVVFPLPPLNNAPQTAAAVRRVLLSVAQYNTTIIQISTPKPLQQLSRNVITTKKN